MDENLEAQRQFPWRRLWFTANAGASRTYGYLPDNAVTRAVDGIVEQGVILDDLRDVQCLVLLGSPGLGKTSEMHQAARQAAARGESYSFVSLGRLSGPEELEERIRRHVDGPDHNNNIWNIFLDGLDEALFQFAQTPQVISNVLRALAELKKFDSVRVRISCRSAEWPSILESELQSLWGKDGVQIYELAKLSKSDALIAANQVLGPDAPKFLDQIEEREAEPLASRPVTLIMLLNVFRKDGSLPSQQVQLYRQALLASIEEANANRRLYRHVLRLDTRSKLMVAARIAAACIFSNNAEIWTGLQSQVPLGRAITLSSVAGGYEPALGMSFPVGEAELYEALLTSLSDPALSAVGLGLRSRTQFRSYRLMTCPGFLTNWFWKQAACRKKLRLISSLRLSLVDPSMRSATFGQLPMPRLNSQMRCRNSIAWNFHRLLRSGNVKIFNAENSELLKKIESVLIFARHLRIDFSRLRTRTALRGGN